MGLYQYIREQKHRKDLVGELGRWMVNNPAIRPDHKSLAFTLAQKEFNACGEWTREAALERLNRNKDIQRILKTKHRYGRIIQEALKTRAARGYKRDSEYSRIKNKMSNLFGDTTEKDSNDFNVILHFVFDLLPPDKNDLYPDGVYKNIELDL